MAPGPAEAKQKWAPDFWLYISRGINVISELSRVRQQMEKDMKILNFLREIIPFFIHLFVLFIYLFIYLFI